MVAEEFAGRDEVWSGTWPHAGEQRGGRGRKSRRLQGIRRSFELDQRETVQQRQQDVHVLTARRRKLPRFAADQQDVQPQRQKTTTAPARGNSGENSRARPPEAKSSTDGKAGARTTGDWPRAKTGTWIVLPPEPRGILRFPHPCPGCAIRAIHLRGYFPSCGLPKSYERLTLPPPRASLSRLVRTYVGIGRLNACHASNEPTAFSRSTDRETSCSQTRRTLL